MAGKDTTHTRKISETALLTTMPGKSQSPTLTRMQESKRHKLLHAKNSKVKILKIGQNSIIIKKMVKDNKLKINSLTPEPITPKTEPSTAKP
jgi:hypothetical protein